MGYGSADFKTQSPPKLGGKIIAACRYPAGLRLFVTEHPQPADTETDLDSARVLLHRSVGHKESPRAIGFTDFPNNGIQLLSGNDCLATLQGPDCLFAVRKPVIPLGGPELMHGSNCRANTVPHSGHGAARMEPLVSRISRDVTSNPRWPPPSAPLWSEIDPPARNDESFNSGLLHLRWQIRWRHGIPFALEHPRGAVALPASRGIQLRILRSETPHAPDHPPAPLARPATA